MANICLILLVSGMLGLASGCSKKGPAATAPPSPEMTAQSAPTSSLANSPEPVPLPAAPAPVVSAAEANLPQINQAYLGWIMKTRKHAKTVEEYVAASGAQLPSAPAGRKYIIDKHGYIALVNR